MCRCTDTPNPNTHTQGLFSASGDDSGEVRKNVCRALVQLVEVGASDLLPHIHPIVEYMLIRTQDSNEVVSLEACEFWLTLADQSICLEALSPYLHRFSATTIVRTCLTPLSLCRVVPVLLNGMKYSGYDVLLLKVPPHYPLCPPHITPLCPPASVMWMTKMFQTRRQI